MSSSTYPTWGSEIDPAAHEQMRRACDLAVSRHGALMPDAHVGYGLPIGGVLATEGAVIPYAVGVDIACRVMISVLPIEVSALEAQRDRLVKAIEENTRFGMGGTWKERRSHGVLDEDWGVTPVTRPLKDLAWTQLGTSGSGNHFVDLGVIEIFDRGTLLDDGTYLAIVSHSGSRGAGAKVANHYSKLAMSLHPELSGETARLAWLPMSGEGAEYWNAMELIGRYASANHHVIHSGILKALGTDPLLQIENHHNFAWKESHFGKELIVHRKGATPADKGVLGFIPGSMVAPGYLVQGLGNSESLNSCSHGAGRAMSRTQARKLSSQKELRRLMEEQGVTLLSAGTDEAPGAYKDIDRVMAAQTPLAKPIGRFTPRIVKMAPEGEAPED